MIVFSIKGTESCTIEGSATICKCKVGYGGKRCDIKCDRHVKETEECNKCLNEIEGLRSLCKCTPENFEFCKSNYCDES